MIFFIIYLLGWIPAVFRIADLCRQKTIGVPAKIGLSVALFLLSWIGVFAYEFVGNYFISHKIRLQ